MIFTQHAAVAEEMAMAIPIKIGCRRLPVLKLDLVQFSIVTINSSEFTSLACNHL